MANGALTETTTTGDSRNDEQERWVAGPMSKRGRWQKRRERLAAPRMAGAVGGQNGEQLMVWTTHSRNVDGDEQK